MNLNLLSALAEPNRFNIVELLRGGPLPVGYIAQRLNMHQPQASKHLKVLAEAKIVAVKPRAQQRLYYLRPQTFKELEGWVKSMESKMDRLDDFLKETKE